MYKNQPGADNSWKVTDNQTRNDNIMNFEFELIQVMASYDLHINMLNLEPGRYHRFRSLGTCKTKCCEYRIFENQLGAHFKCFRRGIDRFWFGSSTDRPTLVQRTAMALERERIEQARLQDQANIAVRCDKFFTKLQQKSKPIKHWYVTRKQIYPHYALQARSLLVLPVRDINYKIQTLQFIKRNGFKQFKPGAPSSKGMIWLTPHLPTSYDGVIRICEGWSTGCTIYSITKSPVICALNAHNLKHVAVELRRKYIHSQCVICADNDQWGAENIGLIKGKEAAEKAALPLIYPIFEGLNTQNNPTDFNDLFFLGGLELTKRQLIIEKA